jgi:hypothetical protein
MLRDYIRGCFQVGPDSRCVASEAGSFIDDESPELLTLQVASRAPLVSNDDFKMASFSFIFVFTDS